MLEHTLDSRRAASNFRATEPPAEADGIVEAWLEFETQAGRGTGVISGSWTAWRGRC